MGFQFDAMRPVEGQLLSVGGQARQPGKGFRITEILRQVSLRGVRHYPACAEPWWSRGDELLSAAFQSVGGADDPAD